jgi:DNA-binding transcriptional regulator/RsmH inhibitor MraZ
MQENVQNKDTAVDLFFGVRSVKLDGQERIQIPIEYRSGLSDNLLVSHVFNNVSFKIFPGNYFKENNIPEPLCACVNKLHPDKEGRISLRSLFEEISGYSKGAFKELTLVGCGSYMELWTPEAWAEESQKRLKKLMELIAA